MNLLKWILLAVCVLKAISFTLYLILNPVALEINQFFEREFSRKYNAHSMDLGYISGSSEMIMAIARDSTKKYLGNRDKDKWPELKRTRFQDYARYLKSIDTALEKSSDIDLKCYPKLLQNTIAEESAKREVLEHFKNLKHQSDEFSHANLTGLITGINVYSNSMQVKIVPFVFESQLQFDFCKCNSKIVSEKSNPFYYTGSLFDWECTFQHPQTKEIQVYDLKAVE